MTEFLLVFTTFASEDEAARVVRTLVEERLIACGNVLPGARSLYRWQGEVKDEREVMAILKTRKSDWPALMSRLSELHSYETPEIVAVRIGSGSPAYLTWLEQSLAPEESA
jgi:periplasmic divalent cation tolerance protein